MSLTRNDLEKAGWEQIALQFITDTFTRSNSPSSMGSTEGGELAWEYYGGVWGIFGNAVYKSSGAGDSKAFVNNQRADITLEATLPAVDPGSAIMWRNSADNLNCYIIYIGTGGTAFSFKQVAGAYGAIIANYGTFNTGDTLKVAAVGNVHTIYRNGAQIGTFTDSFNNTATRHGFRTDASFGSATGRYDNFKLY